MDLCPQCNSELNKRIIGKNRTPYVSVYCLNVDCDYQTKEEVKELQTPSQVEKAY